MSQLRNGEDDLYLERRGTGRWGLGDVLEGLSRLSREQVRIWSLKIEPFIYLPLRLWFRGRPCLIDYIEEFSVEMKGYLISFLDVIGHI